MTGSAPYPPIEDYALLGDGRGSALVSRECSVDWCCIPRFDSAAVFGRILDWERGGHVGLEPVSERCTTTRRYEGDSLLLVTSMDLDSGSVEVTDCLIRQPSEGAASELARFIVGTAGSVDVRMTVEPRFDHGTLTPWFTRRSPQSFAVVGGDDALLVWTDACLEQQDGCLAGMTRIDPSSPVRLSIRWLPPERLDGDLDDPDPAASFDRRIDATRRWWAQWGATGGTTERHPTVRRSAVVLKGLIYEPTGAIVAAPTTSLPEVRGGARNWDYRLSWVRDSQFTVRSLADLGYVKEADAYRRFVQRAAAGSAAELQVMYGVTGRRRLPEHCLPLDGYGGARPVRVGNEAAGQNQHDVYGYLLELSWHWHLRGRSPDEDDWRFLVGLVDQAASRWERPDAGIWEIRHHPLHFVHSKVMCWAALDRGIRLARSCGLKAPVSRWERTREAIRAVVDGEGYDRRRHTFRRSLGADDVDAALLLLPQFDFVPFDDERMEGTVAAVQADLDDDGLLRRYRSDDGLTGHEGAFVACTFWLSECLANQGRLREAEQAFARASGAANDLGLFSEEVDPITGAMLGNFPQGLTHLSHIAAALAIERAADGP